MLFRSRDSSEQVKAECVPHLRWDSVADGLLEECPPGTAEIEEVREELNPSGLMWCERSPFGGMDVTPPSHRTESCCHGGCRSVPMQSSVDGHISVLFKAVAIGTLLVRQFVEVIVEEEVDSLRVGVVRRWRRIEDSLVVSGYQVLDCPTQISFLGSYVGDGRRDVR